MRDDTYPAPNASEAPVRGVENQFFEESLSHELSGSIAAGPQAAH